MVVPTLRSSLIIFRRERIKNLQLEISSEKKHVVQLLSRWELRVAFG